MGVEWKELAVSSEFTPLRCRADWCVSTVTGNTLARRNCEMAHAWHFILSIFSSSLNTRDVDKLQLSKHHGLMGSGGNLDGGIPWHSLLGARYLTWENRSSAQTGKFVKQALCMHFFF